MTAPMKPQKDTNKHDSTEQTESAILRHEQSVSLKYSGPIPSPEFVARYEEICPGAAERILSMAEKVSDTNRGIRERESNAEISLALKGQFFGLIVALVGLAVAALAVIDAQPWIGGIVGGGSLIGLVGQFVNRATKTSSVNKQKPDKSS